jgi:membrane protein YqaA with SNARE-associated domain
LGEEGSATTAMGDHDTRNDNTAQAARRVSRSSGVWLLVLCALSILGLVALVLVLSGHL